MLLLSIIFVCVMCTFLALEIDKLRARVSELESKTTNDTARLASR